MIIAGRVIGRGHPPYLIVEASANHVGKLPLALRLIEEAKRAGADAVKFQCYTADTITFNPPWDNPEFIIKGGLWDGQHLYDLYRKTETPFEWFPQLFEHARKVGITLFSSVFDTSSVDFLETLGCPAYKIASMEITNLPLIAHAARTGKPLIISTGMATDQEIWEASTTAGSHNLLLHCVSGYPTPVAEAGLERLRKMVLFEPTGISDHSRGWDVAVAATAMGACAIEKHLMLHDTAYSDLAWPEDAEFSLNPLQFYHMVEHVKEIWQAVQPREAPPPSEDSSRAYRQSLYVVAPVKQGELLTDKNVRSIRPCFGLPPKELYNILGKKAAGDIVAGTALTWSLVTPAS